MLSAFIKEKIFISEFVHNLRIASLTSLIQKRLLAIQNTIFHAKNSDGIRRKIVYFP